jgi:hypothetical protein
LKHLHDLFPDHSAPFLPVLDFGDLSCGDILQVAQQLIESGPVLA